MRKLIFLVMAASAFMASSAFAENLGRLSDEQKPQNLLPASEFMTNLNRLDADTAEGTDAYSDTGQAEEASEEAMNPSSTTEEARRGRGRGRGHGYGYGYYYPYYYPYYSPYYYPYYYYPYYGYGYGHGHRRHRLADRGSVSSTEAPVICFSESNSGNLYASTNEISRADVTQQAANEECLASGESCNQNLGCALVAQ